MDICPRSNGAETKKIRIDSESTKNGHIENINCDDLDSSVKSDSKDFFRSKLRTRPQTKDNSDDKNKNAKQNMNKRKSSTIDFIAKDQNDSRLKRIRLNENLERNEKIHNETQKNESKLSNDNQIKMVIYKANDFLAVRNENKSFFLCRAKQNIYQNGRKIKIQWYSNDENPCAYSPDFYDFIDFECILTNIRVNRLDKGEVSLPEQEESRIRNILSRALNVENGINEPPDPAKVMSDGLDISMIGKLNDEYVLMNLNHVDQTNVNGLEKDSTTTQITDDEVIENDIQISDEIVRIKPFNGEKITQSIVRIESDVTDLNSMDTTKNSVSIQNSDGLNEDANNSKSEKKKKSSSAVIDAPSHLNLVDLILNGDYESLEKIANSHEEDIDQVSTFTLSQPKSVSIGKNAIHYAIEKEDYKALKLLYDIDNSLKANPFLQMSFSSELFQSELMMDIPSKQSQNQCKIFPLDEKYLRFMLKSDIRMEFMQKISRFFRDFLSILRKNYLIQLKNGNFQAILYLTRLLKSSFREGPFTIIEKILEANRNIQNEYDSLSQPVSESWSIYPIHLAAINPDPFLFNTLIDMYPNQIYVCDSESWMPIHYASICSTFFNIQNLLNLGVSIRYTDYKGNTPLHLATKHNRFQNVLLILSYETTQISNLSILNSYNHKGLTPLHIVCKKGYMQIFDLFIQNNIQIDFATSHNAEELTPLMIATKYGHFEIVKKLIDNGASIHCYDKKNRSALTHAVINGHSEIFDYLLDLKANPSGKDLFGNSLFHYASAYGWHSCFKKLLKTNINLKDTNTFGLTPIQAAFQKCHMNFIEYILKKNILSVNVPVNDSGINLVMMTFFMKPNKKTVEYLKNFVEKFKCDLSKTDYEGNNALHYLLKCEAKYGYSELSVINAIDEALTIVLKNGCDIYLKNHFEVSPLIFALMNKCFISFSRFFNEYCRSKKFLETLSSSEYFWPMIISYMFEDFCGQKNYPIFQINIRNFVHTRDKIMMEILKTSAFNTNTSGDLPIEYFIKMSGRFAKHFERDESEYLNFLDLILQFYDSDFLDDIQILHLSAEFGSESINRRLTECSSSIDQLNDSNESPLMAAIINNNLAASKVFLSSKAEINQKIQNMHCFLFYLKNAHSLCLVPFFLEYDQDFKHQTDHLGNTALHLICSNINRDHLIESLELLIDRGFDINQKNFLDETMLHVFFKNRFNSSLLTVWNLLLSKDIDVYVKDQSGYTAFYYLFNNHSFDRAKYCEEIIKKINFNQLESSKLSDLNQQTLLHYSARNGMSRCLSHLLKYFDPNCVDADNHSPLALAILQKHRDATLILLRSDKIRISENLEFISEQGKKINLLWRVRLNNWKDAFSIIEDKFNLQNEINELVQILIKSRCLENALKLMRGNIPLELSKTYLLLFGKYTTMDVDDTVQREFLEFYDKPMLEIYCSELFGFAITNWNHFLCFELINLFGICKIIEKACERNVNFVSLAFRKLTYEVNLSNEMKRILEMIIQKGQSINVLANYPIIENRHNIFRYEFAAEHHTNALTSKIEYTPFIVAIIKKSYETIKWLMSLKVNRKHIIDITQTDSLGRSPLIHSIIINDVKIIEILLNSNDFEKLRNSKSNTPITLMVKSFFDRDQNNFSVFHHLISPFESGYYYTARKILAKIWNMIPTSRKNNQFINELNRFAANRPSKTIVDIIGKAIQSEQGIGQNLNEKNLIDIDHFDQKEAHNIKLDVCRFLKEFSDGNHSKASHHKQTKTNIITDYSSNIPYNVTFTKLENQNEEYVYNFYKVQLYSVGDLYCMLICWGRVGTQGNVKKIFYEHKDDAIGNFQAIFANKTGENWTKVACSVGEDKYKLVTSNLFPHSDPEPNERSPYFKCSDFNDVLEKFQTFSFKNDFHKFILMSLLKLRLIFNKREYNYEYLSTEILAKCSFLLCRLSTLIAYNSLSKNTNKKENLKLMNDMIDLSEQFYATTKIFGEEFYRLKPILSMQDIRDKSILVRKLKSIVFGIEFLFYILKSGKLSSNPWSCLMDSFRWSSNRQLFAACEEEEIDMIQIYLSTSTDVKFFNVISYKIYNGGSNGRNQSKIYEYPSTYLLWYQLKSYELFNLFINGFENQVIVLKSDPPIIVNGISFMNRVRIPSSFIETDENLDSENLDDYFHLLCDVFIKNPIDMTQINKTREEIYPLLREKDCLIIKGDSSENNHQDDFFIFKDSILPLNKRSTHNPDEYILLNTKQIYPRYLVRLEKKFTNSSLENES